MPMSQNNKAEEIDEHDLPTEPIPRIDPASFMPTVPVLNSAASPDEGTIPAPQPQERPFPQEPGPSIPAQQSPHPSSPNGAYPYLPPAPVIPKRKKGRRGGEAIPVQPANPGKQTPSGIARRSPIPALVGLCFVGVQMLLLVRFILKLINLPVSALWVGALYGTSDLFLWPFHAIVQQVTLPIPNNIEVWTLLAILLYGLLSRFLVRLLKALLHSSKPVVQ